MKTKILTAATLALLATSSVSTVQAHDGWSVAGKVLTGLAAASIISHAIEPHPVVYYAPQPVVYQTVPTYTYQTVPTTAYVTSQPVAATAPVPVTATVPNAQVVPNAPTMAPQTVVVQPQPTVVYQQPAVVYAPAPVVYSYPAPCFYPPRIGFGVVIGGGHYHRRW